ncbi:hypothetical protein HDU98_001534, partial [Podochytrium sp. JEL0797]
MPQVDPETTAAVTTPAPVPQPDPNATKVVDATFTKRPQTSSSSATSSSNVLISGSGDGTYYFDITGAGCADQPYLAETLVTVAQGYTSCEKYNGMPLAARGDNNIVALAIDQMNGNKDTLCGKRVIVSYDGKVVPGTFVVWDSCVACTGGVRLDFSLGALLEIEPNTCHMGVVPGISWEVTDEQ